MKWAVRSIHGKEGTNLLELPEQFVPLAYYWHNRIGSLDGTIYDTAHHELVYLEPYNEEKRICIDIGCNLIYEGDVNSKCPKCDSPSFEHYKELGDEIEERKLRGWRGGSIEDFKLEQEGL